MRTLLVAATEQEAAALPRAHPAVAGLLICGAGKTAAAAALAASLAAVPPEERADLRVLNVGTAGALRDGVAGLLRPSTVWAWDFSAEPIRALGVPAVDELPIAAGDGTVLASGDAFVADAALRDRLGERASIVDMEAFALAFACDLLGVRFEALKWVSDGADAEAARTWSAMVDRGAAALAAAALELLEEG